MEKSNNPSAVRSRKLLTHALLQLMEKKHFYDIQVSELVKKAGLSRKTFYRNFTGKEEILDIYLNELFNEYIDALSENAEFTPYAVVYSYFCFCSRHLDFLRLLDRQNLMPLILEKYESCLASVGKIFQGISDSHSIQGQYHLAFSSGGFWRILCHWIRSNAQQTPAQMADICISFLEKSL